LCPLGGKGHPEAYVTDLVATDVHAPTFAQKVQSVRSNEGGRFLPGVSSILLR